MLSDKLLKLLEDRADDLLQPHPRKVRKQKRAKLDAEIAEWIKDFQDGFPRLRAEVEKYIEAEMPTRYSNAAGAEILTYIWTSVLPVEISNTNKLRRNNMINTAVYNLAYELADKFYRG